VSKQLAISVSASIFAMAAFTLFATPGGELSHGSALNEAGATVEAAAPVFDRVAPALFDLIG
jgi:hypothetical protein